MKLLISIAFSILASSAFASKQTIDTTASQLSWAGTKVVGGGHNGKVAIKEGHVEVEGASIKSGTIVIDMKSIVNNDVTAAEDNKKLVGHLMSDDFFAVDKNPTATLNIKKVEGKKDGNFLVTGDLTIRGTTKPVSFPATIKETAGTWEAHGNLEVNRKEFGITYGTEEGMMKTMGKIVKDRVISDKFKIDFNVKTKKG